MKSIIIKSLSCLLLVASLWSCSSDAALQEEVNASSRENFTKKNGSVWQGVIGEDRNGVYVITADTNALKLYLESLLKKDGQNVTIETLAIEKKTSGNNPADSAFMLIGSSRSIGGNSTSIGLMLSLARYNFTVSAEPRTSTMCRGCTDGCNLSYYNINGKRVPYCNENGCSSYNCEKSEIEM